MRARDAGLPHGVAVAVCVICNVLVHCVVWLPVWWLCVLIVWLVLVRVCDVLGWMLCVHLCIAVCKARMSRIFER